MFTKKMLFVYNANAGKGYIRESLSEIIEKFSHAGMMITIYATGAPKEATKLISRIGSEYDIVACSGGDGTINEVVTGVMRLEKKPQIAYFPTGTVNDFARSLGIPMDPLENADNIIKGRAFACDIGSFGEKYFNYVAGFGAFTEVSYETPQEVKNTIGKLAYFFDAIRLLPDLRGYNMRIEADDKVYEGEYIYGMVSNSFTVGGFKLDRYDINSIPVSLNDGVFEVILVRNPKDAIELESTLRGMVTRDIDNPYLDVIQAKKVRIISDTEIKWTLDGENGGKTTDVTILCNDRAVEIFSPK